MSGCMGGKIICLSVEVNINLIRASPSSVWLWNVSTSVH